MDDTIKFIRKKFDKFKARLDSDSKESNPDPNQKTSRSRKADTDPKDSTEVEALKSLEGSPILITGCAGILSPASNSFSGSTDRKDNSLSMGSSCSSSSSSAASLSTTSADPSSSNSISTTAGKKEHSKLDDRKGIV